MGRPSSSTYSMFVTGKLVRMATVSLAIEKNVRVRLTRKKENREGIEIAQKTWLAEIRPSGTEGKIIIDFGQFWIPHSSQEHASASIARVRQRKAFSDAGKLCQFAAALAVHGAVFANPPMRDWQASGYSSRLTRLIGPPSESPNPANRHGTCGDARQCRQEMSHYCAQHPSSGNSGLFEGQPD